VCGIRRSHTCVETVSVLKLNLKINEIGLCCTELQTFDIENFPDISLAETNNEVGEENSLQYTEMSLCSAYRIMRDGFTGAKIAMTDVTVLSETTVVSDGIVVTMRIISGMKDTTDKRIELYF
jgi:hypothetical protein